MTAPAVARGWEQVWPRPARPGVAALLRDRLVAARRAGPLCAVLLTALVGQVAVAPHLAVGGVAPEPLLVTVAAVAVSRGPRTGAALGFAAGLGADLFRATPLGTVALAYTVVGHLLGRRRRPPAAGTAAALCRPESPCFACRTGRRLRSRPHSGSPTGRSRRASARREGLRRSVALTVTGVAAGRLMTATVATALAGVPFPHGAGLLPMAGAAAISVPLGPPVFAAVRRMTGGGGR